MPHMISPIDCRKHLRNTLAMMKEQGIREELQTQVTVAILIAESDDQASLNRALDINGEVLDQMVVEADERRRELDLKIEALDRRIAARKAA